MNLFLYGSDLFQTYNNCGVWIGEGGSPEFLVLENVSTSNINEELYSLPLY